MIMASELKHNLIICRKCAPFNSKPANFSLINATDHSKTILSPSYYGFLPVNIKWAKSHLIRNFRTNETDFEPS